MNNVKCKNLRISPDLDSSMGIGKSKPNKHEFPEDIREKYVRNRFRECVSPTDIGLEVFLV